MADPEDPGPVGRLRRRAARLSPRRRSHEFQVRLVAPGDEDLWASAVERFWKTRPSAPSSFLDDPATVAVVATADGAPVGWVWGHRLARPDGSTMLLVYEVEVDRPWRRRGVGSAMLDTVLAVASHEGHEKTWLVTSWANHGARQLFESAGAAPSPDPDLVFVWRDRG